MDPNLKLKSSKSKSRYTATLGTRFDKGELFGKIWRFKDQRPVTEVTHHID